MCIATSYGFNIDYTSGGVPLGNFLVVSQCCNGLLLLVRGRTAKPDTLTTLTTNQRFSYLHD